MSRDEEAAERRARAAARAARFADVADDDGLTPDERMELVAKLTRAAWALTGQPWPSLPRDQWPIRVRRLGEEP